MPILSITACSFYLKKNYSRLNRDIYNLNGPINITNSDGSCNTYSDAFAFFKNFFGKYELMEVDEDKMQSYKCEFSDNDRIESNNYNLYCARIFSGEYGSTSDIINLQTKKFKYSKNVDDIDVKPFYVFIVIPKDNGNVKVQKGMLIFQNLGAHGIKTITVNLMQDFFSKEYGITIQCNCIAPKLFIDRILKRDKVKKICLIKNYKSKDISDDLSMGYGTEVRVLSDLNLKENQWERIINSVKYASQAKCNLFEFEHKKYDNAKINVRVGEHDRTINVHNIDKLSIIEDIPDEIKDVDGHPNKDMLKKHIISVIDDYLSEMVLTIEGSNSYE